jgi:RNA polymerase sigma-70 factor, ECF subfamily
MVLGPSIAADGLRLIFVCCHPLVSLDAQVAVTLWTVAGLQTVPIVRAFHVPEATRAQRIVRAKRVLATRRVPYEVPEGEELAARLPTDLDVVYLIFTSLLTAPGPTHRRRCPPDDDTLELLHVVGYWDGDFILRSFQRMVWFGM